MASIVISMSLAKGQAARAASITAATVSGSMSEGVPPPRKIERRVRPGVSRPARAISAASAAPQRRWSMVARDVGVEVAVGALGEAEGPVDVEPEAARLPVLRMLRLPLRVQVSRGRAKPGGSAPPCPRVAPSAKERLREGPHRRAPDG